MTCYWQKGVNSASRQYPYVAVDPTGGQAGPSKLQRRKGGAEEGAAGVHCTPRQSQEEEERAFRCLASERGGEAPPQIPHLNVF